MSEQAVAGIDSARVGAWLEANVPGVRGPFTYRVIAGGLSNLTYHVLPAEGRRMVLRRPPLGHVLASAHDMGREHRIIAALRDSPVPVPEALGFCDDPDVNGAPFYVMAYVEGTAIHNPAEAEAALDAEARPRVAEALVDTLAAIHAVDPTAVGLGDLGRHEGYIARQLKRWLAQYEQSTATPAPEIADVHRILSARIPEQGPAAIVHGDYRLDNCLVTRDGRVAAVLDWELCTLGDPMADVGLLGLYWVGPGDEHSGLDDPPTVLPGFPSRAQVLERYAQTSGRSLEHIDFYLAFANWKLACILEGVRTRYLLGAMGEGSTVEVDALRRRIDRCARTAAEIAARLV